MCEGGVGDFHLSKIKRLASKVTKDIKADSEEEKGIEGGDTPNNAIVALGSINL